MRTVIESLQNEKIKYLYRLLSDNRFRKKEKKLVVEGVQENRRALDFGYEHTAFYLCPSIFSDAFALPENAKIYEISEKIYQKLAYRGTTEGILGLYQTPYFSLADYQPSANAAVIIVESIEKPGNLGAILRSCEAFGIEALILSDIKIDLYNPNVLRSSVGCLFGMKVFQSDNTSILDFLKQHQFSIFTTFMSYDAQMIDEKDFTQKSALVFGTEHSGISPFWENQGENVLIPMTGTIDSLNLSNAVAISCYEILRQKRKNHQQMT
ncbi:TrmH family RNA methyltransferase [Riemerella columbina]|uniref:TrmH family RNA methyltransferase n=1 Tax=Riemerella columbina TaxID=103810 RepID=UPI00266F151A|nr:TrmH family RNA methyltransferase [Riemerella columbina]WKS95015.1 RNA methyltransferase [Riemerella columbina]